MKRNNVYLPLVKRFEAEMLYVKHMPNSFRLKSEYRSKYDLDCQHLKGDLNADMIFSLWLPLRYVLFSLNGKKMYKLTADSFTKKNLTEIYNNLICNIDEYLPYENELVIKLSKFYSLAMGRENVMRLPDRALNSKRGMGPYYDYIPYFLEQSFEGGDFSSSFENNNTIFVEWIKKEKLELLFKENMVDKKNILDLAGSNDLHSVVNKNNINVNFLLDSYINVLEKRKKLLSV